MIFIIYLVVSSGTVGSVLLEILNSVGRGKGATAVRDIAEEFGS